MASGVTVFCGALSETFTVEGKTDAEVAVILRAFVRSFEPVELPPGATNKQALQYIAKKSAIYIQSQAFHVDYKDKEVAQALDLKEQARAATQIVLPDPQP